MERIVQIQSKKKITFTFALNFPTYFFNFENGNDSLELKIQVIKFKVLKFKV